MLGIAQASPMVKCDALADPHMALGVTSALHRLNAGRLSRSHHSAPSQLSLLRSGS
jgi:hypothetical protein